MAEEKKFVPFVSSDTSLPEMTMKALILGLIMAVVLGAANAYLGLKAGMTIAATYPAAVIGMAVLRLMKGSILEENIARTVGSIGESVAAGAIFTIPAFMIAGIWDGANFGSFRYYIETSIILLVGGVIGILFVTILRRVMVEDKDLPFPESVAAGEIHKAGRTGKSGAKFLFGAMGIGGLIQVLIKIKFFAAGWEHFIGFASKKITLANGTSVTTSGGGLLSTPGVSPAYMGVGYIIGPNLAALNFTGGLLAWGLFVPLLMYFLGPQISAEMATNGTAINNETWIGVATSIWKSIVRPIAIGGMLMSAAFTLWRMRKSLAAGLKRAIGDVSKAATSGKVAEDRVQKDMNFKWVFIGIFLAGIATFFIYNYYAQNVLAALVATLVMIIAGFFFSAVSGYLVGLIGSSNNPISGLTISTLIVAAILMVALGMKGAQGIAAVLGVAAVVCVGAAVAGEMLQDLKVGHILGGTPWKMQVGDLFGVLLSAAVMFWPLWLLHQGDIMDHGGQFINGVTGLGGESYPAPQASLMAIISSGIVGGDMAWPLIVVGIIMAIGFILVKVKSPMLVCVGMYLPLETSFAIFVGGLIKGIYEKFAARSKFNDNQKARSENVGVLLAAGLIAGEALIGLLFAALIIFKVKIDIPSFLNLPFYVSLLVFIAVGYILVRIPMKNAGNPDEPAPPMTM
ncbi:MAG: oligopeptide transporter, OPT family [Ignavibacteria bacterium GWB2_35_12]|nr:MAG: oligopeptide transporter, OPT family [Ignavibacteria bacterium GWA2_35_8]OGU38931.1 MAG: oligopeptide transporter, OPT family [Ignavibacteria bacterium GWB2_35_12]OGU88421.1 MAG: oligopeptide transporter, OPT family [Ignavibacteria bacterium RIFOXYA2_FULL_35_10]OGV20409.1 MAG: oligopeptide transporter, OPT family [Ignavibacteria bacterium RIFOXYC2_FULL_35_21]